MKNEIDARAAEWVAREDRGELTQAEAAALQAWLAADSRHLGAYVRMQAIMLRCERVYRGDTAHARRAQAPRWRHAARRLRAALAVAAAVVLAAASSLYLYSTNAGVHSTRPGEIARFTLRDGSLVTMNSDSRLRVRYDDDERRIELLRGEAIFDVAKDKAHPFVVAAGDTKVVAVGTSFEVRRDSALVSVLVREGIVKVEEGDRPSFRLVANDKAKIERMSMPVISRLDEAEFNRELAWREGMVAFTGETLDQVAKEFARYSTMRIRIADPETAKLGIVGRFSATDPIGFSRAAAQSLHLDMSMNGNEIVLRRKAEKNLR